MAYLEVRNIRKSFNKTEVLKGIDFDLDQGQVLSIIGSSGSGKTTLLRCLNYLETADEGTISLNGDVIFDALTIKNESYDDIRTKRLNWGMVFQQFNLFPQYTALQNVMLAPNESIPEVLKYKKKELLEKYKDKSFFERKKLISQELSFIKRKLTEDIKQNAIDILNRVGLSDKMNNYPCELSGGQQQRVAIARALALKPRILCFDEPTSALDPELTGEVLKVIKELKYSTDCTMIIVTHEMDFAKNVSDKIIFMANGIVEEMGTPSEIFDNPKSEKTISFLSKSREDIFDDISVNGDKNE